MSKVSHDPNDPGKVIEVPLHQVTRSRFLNYAVSVITSRALPDVRDGLKPVQRRILYTMYRDLRLLPDKKTLKCAKVVGQVLGNYHPHGDSAVYEALVRMAQPWALRYPLIYGQGNFGSLDGDPAAAYRYTEARLEPVAVPFLDEIEKETVDFRPTFDESTVEPVVLPTRVPQLLVNGCTGIAVGVATNIPPHNLKEVIDAAVALIDEPDLDTAGLLKLVKGPDFPTGGEILEDRASLIELYEKGQGRIRLRGEYEVEELPRKGQAIIIKSIPYMVNKSSLVEEIGQIIIDRKVPQLVDVRDESTDDVRIVLELKRGADPETVLAYLYKNTNLRTNFHVNMTCLVPEHSQVGVRPDRIGLKPMLRHFNDFRYKVLTRRLAHELRLLRERIHILRGFQIVFADLDEALEIIRTSEGRKDSQEKIMARFGLDEVQTNAILDMRLYKLGRPDIAAVLDELDEKLKMEQELENLLDSPQRLWGVVKNELREVGEKFGDKRRTKILARGAEELTYNEESFIVAEDATVLLSRDGWVRRVGKVGDLSKVRLRQGDELQAVLRGSTLSTMVFFSNYGTAYSVRVNDIPASARGYGDPIQALFNFTDGERVVAALSLDPRFAPGIEDREEQEPALHALTVASDGRGLRFSLAGLAEPSTKSGRKFARYNAGQEIIDVKLCAGDEILLAATRMGRALVCMANEVNFLSGAGKGVMVMKLAKEDRLIGLKLTTDPNDPLTVIRDEGGKEIEIKGKKLVSRGGKGFPVVKRGLLKVVPEPLEVPALADESAEPESTSIEEAPGVQDPPTSSPEQGELF
ncbi:MAG: DNA topoisomerase (ATP-hydrolyzing) subunit A [Vulcanimicrobiota bacterium]